MENDTIKISRKEYEQLLTFKKIDQELLTDIAKGIKDVLAGRIKEI